MPGESVSTANYVAVIEDLRAKRNEIDRMINMLEAMLPASAPAKLEPPAPPPPSDTGVASEQVGGNTAAMGIGEACVAVLREANKALTTREVADRLAERGFKIESENPMNNVWSALSHRAKSGRDVYKPDKRTWSCLARLEKLREQTPQANGIVVHQ